MCSSDLSRQYLGEVTMEDGEAPRVFVRSPNLHDLAGGRGLPHVYEQRPPRLCLYLPGAREWSRSDLLGETVLPWASLWLFFFEDWLVSGTWKGGGHEPIPPSAKTS